MVPHALFVLSTNRAVVTPLEKRKSLPRGARRVPACVVVEELHHVVASKPSGALRESLGPNGPRTALPRLDEQVCDDARGCPFPVKERTQGGTDAGARRVAADAVK